FKRLSEDPLPLPGRHPGVEVPVELDRVLRRALERDRDQRYPDARAFIVALEKVERALSAAETKEIPLDDLAAAKALPPPAAAPLWAGRRREAQKLIKHVEATNPRAQGLDRLKERRAQPRRAAETEQV